MIDEMMKITMIAMVAEKIIFSQPLLSVLVSERKLERDSSLLLD